MVKASLAVVAPIWPTVERASETHLRLIAAVAQLPQPESTKSGFVVIALAGHAHNLFTEIIGGSLRGYLDVVLHLRRALNDCAGLVFGAGRDEDFAQRFVNDERNLAPVGRKEMAEVLRAEGHDAVADSLGHHFNDHQERLNSGSHVSPLHVDRMLEPTSGGLETNVGGWADEDRVRFQVASALESDLDVQLSLWGVRNAKLEPGWADEILSTREVLREWEATLAPFADLADGD